MTLLVLYVFAGFIVGSITTFALFYHYEPGLVTLRDNYEQQLKQASEAYSAEALHALRRQEQEGDDDREAYLAALERDRHELGLDLIAKIDQAMRGELPVLTDQQKLLFLRHAGGHQGVNEGLEMAAARLEADPNVTFNDQARADEIRALKTVEVLRG